MRLLSRVPKEQDVQLVCGIGHYVRADVVSATYQHIDSDGDPLAPFTVEEYDPPKCIVCGLALWARADVADLEAHGSGCKTPPLGCRIENA